MSCPVCGLSIEEVNALTLHVNEHFQVNQPTSSLIDKEGVVCPDCGDWIILSVYNHHQQEHEESVKRKKKEAKDFQALQEKYGYSSTAGGYAQQYRQHLERAVGKSISEVQYLNIAMALRESTATGKADMTTCTKGLIEMLQRVYDGAKRPIGVTRVYLSSSTDHFGASFGDKGWGCGYRNIQMLSSCLLHNPDYSSKLFDGEGFIPEIPKLQRWIETAWQKGFDISGCDQFGGTLFNSKKWIGATEVAALFCSFGIRTKVIDFPSPTGPNDTHPALFSYVLDYFKYRLQQRVKPIISDPFNYRGSNGNHTLVPPIYLQHMGHSRLIIGVEEGRGGKPMQLLIMDPGCPTPRMRDCVTKSSIQPLRRTLGKLQSKQYQLVIVDGLMDSNEIESSKIITSQRIL